MCSRLHLTGADVSHIDPAPLGGCDCTRNRLQESIPCAFGHDRPDRAPSPVAQQHGTVNAVHLWASREVPQPAKAHQAETLGTITLRIQLMLGPVVHLTMSPRECWGKHLPRKGGQFRNEELAAAPQFAPALAGGYGCFADWGMRTLVPQGNLVAARLMGADSAPEARGRHALESMLAVDWLGTVRMLEVREHSAAGFKPVRAPRFGAAVLVAIHTNVSLHCQARKGRDDRPFAPRHDRSNLSRSTCVGATEDGRYRSARRE